MSIFTRPAPAALHDATTAAASAEHVELHVPAELAPFFAAALDKARATRSFADPDWRKNFDHRALRDRVEHVLVTTEHGGTWPGHVGRPSHRSGLTAMGALKRDGTRSEVFIDSAPALIPPTAEEIAAWRYSEEHKDAYEARVAELVDAIESDPMRLWNTFLHVTALDIARTMKARAETEEQRKKEHVARHRCPLCTQVDPDRNGRVAARSLNPSYELPHFPSKTTRAELFIYSCAACHAVASRDYIEARGAEVLEDGRTRREALRGAIGVG